MTSNIHGNCVICKTYEDNWSLMIQSPCGCAQNTCILHSNCLYFINLSYQDSDKDYKCPTCNADLDNYDLEYPDGPLRLSMLNKIVLETRIHKHKPYDYCYEYKNGQRILSYNYAFNGILHGSYTQYYYSNGKVEYECKYTMNYLDGKYCHYNESPSYMDYETKYKNGYEHGDHIQYEPTDSLCRGFRPLYIDTYKFGIIIKRMIYGTKDPRPWIGTVFKDKPFIKKYGITAQIKASCKGLNSVKRSFKIKRKMKKYL